MLKLGSWKLGIMRRLLPRAAGLSGLAAFRLRCFFMLPGVDGVLPGAPLL